MLHPTILTALQSSLTILTQLTALSLHLQYSNYCMFYSSENFIPKGNH